jgi:anti-sigma B factor antagonist
MSLLLKTRRSGNAVILDLAGRLTAGEPTLLLRETLRRFVGGGNQHFILNLAGVSYIDSAGLGELISAHVSVTSQRGKVSLLNLTERAKGLMQITKLLTVFHSFDDEEKAVAAGSAFLPRQAAV